MRFGAQMLGDKKCPLNGVTSYGTLWRKGSGTEGLECDPE